jgi:hypothetical protein
MTPEEIDGIAAALHLSLQRRGAPHRVVRSNTTKSVYVRIGPHRQDQILVRVSDHEDFKANDSYNMSDINITNIAKYDSGFKLLSRALDRQSTEKIPFRKAFCAAVKETRR